MLRVNLCTKYLNSREPFLDLSSRTKGTDPLRLFCDILLHKEKKNTELALTNKEKSIRTVMINSDPHRYERVGIVERNSGNPPVKSLPDRSLMQRC